MSSPPRLAVILILIAVACGIVFVRVLPRRALRRASANPEPRVRASVVAGTFYPADPDRLGADVQRYLNQAEPAGSPGELVALIVPHAGYVYSGPVAACAYRLLKARRYETVVVVGPSHRVGFGGAALTGADGWATPLGTVLIDRAAGEELLSLGPNARIYDAGHSPEHSIEVQLPFLQTVLDDFKLLPLTMADFSIENCDSLARALADLARGRSVLLVASTDMSHYPAYGDAARVDGETLKSIQTLDAEHVAATTRQLMSEGVPGLSTCLCGEGPVLTVLKAARMMGADHAQVLRYANSGDAPAGSRDRVVGYCAVAVYRTDGRPSETPDGAVYGLDRERQQRLLSVARKAIEEYVRTGRTSASEETFPALLRPAAAFVTLRKHGALRGCIGSLEAEAPLVNTVRDRAIMAATRDPRFPPVRAEELSQLEVEVSVLSPLRKVAAADEIDIGKHGVVVKAGRQMGVFLPSVARETGWSRDVLLAHLCRDKAGLPADAWKRDAELYVFTVQAFSSPAPREQFHARE